MQHTTSARTNIGGRGEAAGAHATSADGNSNVEWTWRWHAHACSYLDAMLGEGHRFPRPTSVAAWSEQ